MYLAGEAGEGFSLQSSLELAGLEMSEEASSLRAETWVETSGGSYLAQLLHP